MFRTSRQRWLLVVLGVFAFALFPAVMLANHSWNGYHWARTSNPFTLKLGNNVSSAWTLYLNNASSDWSQSTVLDTTIVAGGTKPRNCRPTSGRVEVCDASYGNTGWLGLAQIWVSGSHIAQGVVKLNDTYYYPGSSYDTFGWRSLVTCQEIGHTFGLDHQDTNFDNPNLGTCMDYTSNPDGPPSNSSPNQGDYDELLCIYDPASAGKTLSTPTHSCTGTGHLDSTTTVGQTVNNLMPPAMNDVDYSEPHQWGRLIRGSRAAGFAVYDLDFGHGNHIFTFVTWTREAQNQ